MRVLITGANGFIGSHLVDLFAERGVRVRCLVRETSDLRWLSGKDLEMVRCAAFDDETRILESLKNVDLVVHAAGTVTARTPHEYFKINAEPVRLLLDACMKNGAIRRFILVGSQGASGPNSNASVPMTEQDPCRPVSAYGRSKLKAEEITREYIEKVPFTIVRPSVVYGPRDPNLLRVFKAAKVFGRFFNFATHGMAISLVHVQDVAEGVYLAAMTARSMNETYFLAGEHSYGLDEIKAALESSVGRSIKFVGVPNAIKQFMMIYGDVARTVLRKRPLLDRDRLTTITCPTWTCDVSKAKRDFGFKQAISLVDGFQQTYKWYCLQHWA